MLLQLCRQGRTDRHLPQSQFQRLRAYPPTQRLRPQQWRTGMTYPTTSFAHFPLPSATRHSTPLRPTSSAAQRPTRNPYRRPAASIQALEHPHSPYILSGDLLQRDYDRATPWHYPCGSVALFAYQCQFDIACREAKPRWCRSMSHTTFLAIIHFYHRCPGSLPHSRHCHASSTSCSEEGRRTSQCALCHGARVGGQRGRHGVVQEAEL
jgi:hypothetical protein